VYGVASLDLKPHSALHIDLRLKPLLAIEVRLRRLRNLVREGGLCIMSEDFNRAVVDFS
jgi:hypothetical protein